MLLNFPDQPEPALPLDSATLNCGETTLAGRFQRNLRQRREWQHLNPPRHPTTRPDNERNLHWHDIRVHVPIHFHQKCFHHLLPHHYPRRRHHHHHHLNFDVDLRCEAVLLQHAKQIVHLKLPAPYVGDMSYDHVEVFSAALANQSCLEKITMCPETARVLSEYHAHRDLQKAILSLPRLREVDYPEFFQADLLSKLVVKPSMENLSLNERYLTEEQRTNLCAALGSPESQVRTLDLMEVRVAIPTETEAATDTRKEEVKTQWSEVFSTNRSLTKVFLDLFSEPKSADLIGQTLGHHPALQELVLTVGGEQHSQVLAFLAASETLSKLTLYNFCGTVSTISALQQVLEQNRLISLSVDGTLDDQAWHILAPALASCISLQSLTLKSDVVLGETGMGSDILSVLGSSINTNWKSLKDLKVSFPFVNCPLSAVTSFLFSLNENSKLSSLHLDFHTRESWPANLIYAVMSNFGLTHFGGTCLDFDRHHFFTDWLKSLVKGVLVMNRAGRRYLLDDPHDKGKGVKVLAAVYYNLDCIFLHLVENPFLCYRDEPQNADTKSKPELQLVAQERNA